MPKPGTPQPLLITSVPPAAKRVRAGGDFLGRTSESWRNAGFRVLSVNSDAESNGADIDTVTVARSAHERIGRPLVYFADLLRAAIAHSPSTPFAITNADIALTSDSELAQMVSALEPKSFILSRRLDIANEEHRTGTPWFHGFDFFALHPKDAAKILDTDMVFGMPWWDHYLPIALLLHGCRGRQLRGPVAFHVLHDDRYDEHMWNAFGRQFVSEIFPIARGRYRWRLAAARWLRSRKRCLYSVSGANLAFIDRQTLESS
jgi:hypothetical protein